ncbi:MAG: hypothetical protein OWS74_07770 [Firmicutes bacterium]|nr:hypothetical protein [Bacillota bacterium]
MGVWGPDQRVIYETVYVYDPDKDPWRPVRLLLTCPFCGLMARHYETGDPQETFKFLREHHADNPIRCPGCGKWSVTEQYLIDHGHVRYRRRRYVAGTRLACPADLIPAPRSSAAPEPTQ